MQTNFELLMTMQLESSPLPATEKVPYVAELKE